MFVSYIFFILCKKIYQVCYSSRYEFCFLEIRIFFDVESILSKLFIYFYNRIVKLKSFLRKIKRKNSHFYYYKNKKKRKEKGKSVKFSNQTLNNG